MLWIWEDLQAEAYAAPPPADGMIPSEEIEKRMRDWCERVPQDGDGIRLDGDLFKGIFNFVPFILFELPELGSLEGEALREFLSESSRYCWYNIGGEGVEIYCIASWTIVPVGVSLADQEWDPSPWRIVPERIENHLQVALGRGRSAPHFIGSYLDVRKEEIDENFWRSLEGAILTLERLIEEGEGDPERMQAVFDATPFEFLLEKYRGFLPNPH